MADTTHQAVVHELDGALDPAVCCEQIAALPGRIFLDSAARGTRLGRYSFLTADPVAFVRSKGAHVEVREGAVGRDAWRDARSSGDALQAVKALLAPHQTDPIPGLPPFQGGAAGYLAYDWGRVLERLPAPRYDDLALPDVVMGIYDWVIAWDHERRAAWLISTGLPEAPGAARRRRADDRAAAVLDLLRRDHRADANSSTMASSSDAKSRSDNRFTPAAAPSYEVQGGWWPRHLAIRSSFTHQGYVEAVARVRDYIIAGDIFQANLSQRFEAPLTESPWALYRRLRARNAAPFAAYLDLPGATVLSASPERFLRADVNGHVETRPIKGTRPRGFGPEHDAALGAALTESAKDQAENLMIVDLMRNDLSRVCLPGSVRVPELFTLERYATVHHLVSTVEGRLAPGTDALDLLRATFPGGSITGAPKVRAMEIIAELEPSQRGVYCGSIGYLSVTGALDTNIAIRTLVERPSASGPRLFFSAGGGIVADSKPEQEYRETLDKARGIIDVLVAPR